MPELPDVEIFRQEAEKAAGQVIESVDINDSDFLDTSQARFNKYLSGNKLKDTFRRGKYLFLFTENKHAVVMHFGMTGYLKYAARNKDAPGYAKCSFNLENDHRLYYVSKRKLGQVELTDELENFLVEHELGPDALEINKEDFMNALKKSRSMVKSFITDQSVIAGIGNVYADEILFQSRIYPKQPSDEITEAQGREIYDQMRSVLKTAIKKHADVSKLPDSFLLPRRREGEKCPVCKGKVKKIRISGRTGYYCPDCQGKK